MTKKIFIITLILTVLLAAYYILIAATDFSSGKKPNDTIKEWKIAALSPSITEMLYAAGLGNNVAANTTYCLYPPEAAGKPKLGTIMTINYEYAVSLGINAAVLHIGMDKQRENFKNLGMKTIELDMTTIDGILESFDVLGDAFGVEKEAAEAKKKLSDEIQKYSRRAQDGKKPRILAVIFRPAGKGSVEKVTVAGRTGLYNDIIELIGAENAIEDKRQYPEISKEGIISTNPDIIIEIAMVGESVLSLSDEWLYFKDTVNAVKNGRVYVTGNSALSIPGPRLSETVKYFAEAVGDFR